MLTTSASLWYLDEPFAALDKQGIELIEACMQKHLDQGGAIVFSSHQDLVKIAARSYRLSPFTEVM
jgi:heme exporter protein A